MRSLGGLFRSSALRAAFVFTVSGAAFAGANLLLARSLSAREYGLFTLLVSLLYVGYALAPLGAEGVANRRRLRSAPPLLRRAVATSASIGLAVVVLSGLVYDDLEKGALAILALGIAAGGVNRMAAAQYQSRRRFRISLLLRESGNVLLVAAAFLALVLGHDDGLMPVGVLVGGLVVLAAFGWTRLLRDGQEEATTAGAVFCWRDSLSYAFMSWAGYVLIQLERLVVPKVLSLEDLAVFGVLACLVIAPFRVLQLAVGYTLLPRLRAAEDVEARRRLIAREAGLVAALSLVGCAGVFLLAPPLVDWLLAGKYDLTPSLIAVGLAAGFAKMLNGFVEAVVAALTSTRTLALVSGFGWLAVAVAIGGAVLGRPWGLEGVVLGISAGWLARAVASSAVVAPRLVGRTSAVAPARGLTDAEEVAELAGSEP